MNEPDYNANRTMHGGYLKEIPEPHVRMWPGAPFKRKVTVRITRYYGLGEHYYVSIREEDNPIWNPVEKLWQLAWDDKDSRGRADTDMYFDGEIDNAGRFMSYGQAKAFANRVVQKYFPHHEFILDDYCQEWELVRKQEEE